MPSGAPRRRLNTETYVLVTTGQGRPEEDIRVTRHLLGVDLLNIVHYPTFQRQDAETAACGIERPYRPSLLWSTLHCSSLGP